VRGPVAVVTCDVEDADPDSPALLAALAAEGIDAELAVWDDPAVDWDRYELSVIRSTWDYVDKYAAFSDWVARTPRLLNEPAAVAYSLDKHYLRDLERAGVPVVRTVFADVGCPVQLPSGDLVVKPAVGAGSIGAARYDAPDRDGALAHVASLHAEGRDALVQPYIESVDEVGEAALVYIDGTFSYALTKAAMLNTSEEDRDIPFRIEQMSVAPEPSAGLREVADAAIAAAPGGPHLYGRVDLLRVDGGHVVVELELVEPSLFFWLVPDGAGRLARAISARLGPSRRPASSSS
jgi:glutathione synthase/RimK-type ligase-like ATP-grasp enzyme